MGKECINPGKRFRFRYTNPCHNAALSVFIRIFFGFC
jgi:hypothetical protein